MAVTDPSLGERTSVSVGDSMELSDNMPELQRFIEGRPAVCPSIVSVSLDFYDGDPRWPFVKEEEVETVEKSFSCLAKNLKLETLSIVTFSPEEDLEDLLAAKGNYSTITATRQINVTESFFPSNQRRPERRTKFRFSSFRLDRTSSSGVGGNI